MELTDTQKEAVAAWFAAGASLDEIQKRIKAEFGIHLTYLDVRLLVAELPQPEEEEGEGGTGSAGADEANGSAGSAETTGTAGREPLETDEEGEDGGGEPTDEAQAVAAPTVTIDALMLPGTIVSGDVTFSDGKTGKWYLDQMGRLGIGNLPEGYRPSPTDAALFQQQLMQLLQSKGLC